MTCCTPDCATPTALAERGLTARVLRRAIIPFGPLMRARAAMLEARGLIASGQDREELVVIGARHG